MTKRQKLHSLDDVPTSFPSEEAEARFWDTHELGRELLLKLRPPTDPRLPAVRGEPASPRSVRGGSGARGGRRVRVTEAIRHFVPRAPRSAAPGFAVKSGGRPAPPAQPDHATGARRPPPAKK